MKGYISEVFSSFQGEGGCVRGSCLGKRQIFIRFAGCNLAESRRPCVWCDSPQAQKKGVPQAKVEKEPGSMGFKDVSNPLDVEGMVEIVNALKTPDLHSISITGGEPMFQIDFLEELCIEIDEAIYLESNGTLPKAAKRIAGHIDYASVDIKDETALPYSGWEDVVKDEMRTIEVLKEGGADVFAKVVVTNHTEPANVAGYAKRMGELGVPLAIQPVTWGDEKERIGQKRLFRLSEAAAQYLSAEDLTLSFQTHKFHGLL